MKLKKLKIEKKKLDVNLVFYIFLKELNRVALSNNVVDDILIQYATFKDNFKCFNAILKDIFSTRLNSKKEFSLLQLLDYIEDSFSLEIFIFSLRLLRIKSLLLEELKFSKLIEVEKTSVHPLSLKFDNITKTEPYYNRVNGALLALLFFEKIENGENNFISSDSTDFLKILSEQACQLKKIGLEANQIFMLMFTESINQSIVSNAGSSYENRIRSVLLGIGIEDSKIKKIHDKLDKSTEYDFFFEIAGKTYGVSAKRTLRERYKQFIKTSYSTPIDVSIQITLGTDLTEEKARSILNYGSYIFIADDVYDMYSFFKELQGVYKCSDLSLRLLKELGRKRKLNSL